MTFRLISVDIGYGYHVRIEVGYECDIFSLEAWEYATKNGKKLECCVVMAEFAFEKFLEFSGEYWQ